MALGSGRMGASPGTMGAALGGYSGSGGVNACKYKEHMIKHITFRSI